MQPVAENYLVVKGNKLKTLAHVYIASRCVVVNNKFHLKAKMIWAFKLQNIVSATGLLQPYPRIDRTLTNVSSVKFPIFSGHIPSIFAALESSLDLGCESFDCFLEALVSLSIDNFNWQCCVVFYAHSSQYEYVINSYEPFCVMADHVLWSIVWFGSPL